MNILEITPELRARYGGRIQALEASATYPLGTDRFRIDHGQDYFAFFERMGELLYLAALEDEEVIAVGACVLRDVPQREGRASVKAWYLCDLKVRPDHRGEGLPVRLMRFGLERAWRTSSRGYAISMDPGDGSPNRVVRLLSRFSPVRFDAVCTLAIFSLSPAVYAGIVPMLARHRGPPQLVSLQGTKDLVLESTGRRLPLFHVRFGEPARSLDPRAGLAELPRDATCMFCAPREDEIVRELLRQGCTPAASATIVAHDLPHADWGFVVTSEI